MITPEGRIKEKIKDVLKLYEPELWFHMAVPYGYGEQTLDFVGCFHGCFFAVEAKAPGKEPTSLQRRTIARMRIAGGTVFIVDNEMSLRVLADFLRTIVTDTLKRRQAQ